MWPCQDKAVLPQHDKSKATLPDFYSYSLAVGDGSGNEYSTAHEGHITGVRVWEYFWGSFISGIQLRYDSNWTEIVGSNYGTPMEMELFDKESISQVSGKYYNGYIYELMFVTNQGCSFNVGLPAGSSFNFYPTHRESELRFLSGRQNGGGITSIGAHWAMVHNCV
ncbi:zymogen granule membrane protein 16-like [Myxocyprinus asiaticus]|uniref:zymogen granule membrane protein 16-like n=1 Tax=Myxocyprinus asiaticus TaxID=70543 RepID=UPI002221AA46|nr:zymogen granule membrane protein 16-like [Myxocyprinus asiaticus]